MDFDEAITVAKIDTRQDGRYYILIGWQFNSFEMYIFNKDKLWKGRFSQNRLAGFSRNLQMTEEAYYASLKRCLSQQRDNYRYEVKSDFFYWKQKYKNTVVVEGFMPVELVTSEATGKPDIVEVLLALNRNLREKVNDLQSMYNTVRKDYQMCIKDTKEFLNMKVDMEKALCDKFVNLLNIKKNKFAIFKNSSEGTLIKEDETFTEI